MKYILSSATAAAEFFLVVGEAMHENHEKKIPKRFAIATWLFGHNSRDVCLSVRKDIPYVHLSF